MVSALKCRVRLAAEQRREFEAIVRRQSAAATKVRRARILLLADEDHPDGQRPDRYIAEAVGLSLRQVTRVRQQFVRHGAERTLSRKRRETPPIPPKLDGRGEARLIVLCCSDPPAGRDRWTLRLLADELGRLGVVRSIGREAVRRALKKTRSGPGGPSGSASPGETGRGSSPRWKRSSTSTARPTTRRTR
jgi:hypothetical protein